MTNKKSLTIGWLYPELMSTYGDRGNIIVLTKRCEWRGIKVKVEKISLHSTFDILHSSDLLFMGGAQDRQQEIVNKDLFEKKGNTLRELVENRIPGLYICGAYQFLGRYYKTAEGLVLPGLGIFPAYTENSGERNPRLIGNIVVSPRSDLGIRSDLIGFENHGGRTYLDDKSMAFGTVIKGHGNNGNLPAMQENKALQAGDKTEGIIYKNSIGSYLHGPILPKNPEIADWLIRTALEKMYGEEVELKKLEKLDDTLEQKAKEVIVKRLNR